MTEIQIVYNDLSFDKQLEIEAMIKHYILEDLIQEGIDEYKDRPHIYDNVTETQIRDKGIIVAARLYDLDVPDEFDKTKYLFALEEFAEEKAKERIINSFTRLSINI